MPKIPRISSGLIRKRAKRAIYCVAKNATLRAARTDPSPRKGRASQDDNSFLISSRNQSRLDGIIKINLLDGGVGLGALPADAIDVGGGAGGQDLVDLTEAESGAQASGDADWLLRLALGQFGDSSERGVEAVDRKCDRVRKAGIEQEKFRDAQRAKLGGVSFAVGLEGGAGLEQSDPFEILLAFDGLVERMRKAAEVGADQAGDGFGAFDEASELDVMPAFAMRHGRVGDALKQVCAILHGAEEAVRIGEAGVAGGRALDLQKETIELLPHFGAALLPDLAKILAGGGDAGNN